jgi:hypothetical protein
MDKPEKIRELLNEKASSEARLRLLPYNGSPEIKEIQGKRYLYVRKRELERNTSTYVGPYTDELYQMLVRNNAERRSINKQLRLIDKKLAQLGYSETELSPRGFTFFIGCSLWRKPQNSGGWIPSFFMLLSEYSLKVCSPKAIDERTFSKKALLPSSPYLVSGRHYFERLKEDFVSGRAIGWFFLVLRVIMQNEGNIKNRCKTRLSFIYPRKPQSKTIGARTKEKDELVNCYSGL